VQSPAKLFQGALLHVEMRWAQNQCRRYSEVESLIALTGELRLGLYIIGNFSVIDDY